MAVVDPFAAQVWLAQAAGYFKDEGLNLQLNIAGSGLVALAVSGGVDLAYNGFSSALPLPRDGKDISLVYAANGNGATAWVVGTPDVRSVPDCKRAATSLVGSGAYSWAVQLKKWFNANYEILALNDTSVLAATVGSSPDTNCGINNYSFFASQIKSGKLQVIFDPTKPATYPPGYVTGLAEGGIWGLKSTVASKRPAIQKLLKALNRVLVENMKKQTPVELATLLRKNPEFQTFTQESLTTTFQSVLFSYAPDDGYIPAATWPSLLAWFHDGGTTFVEPADPKFSYSAIVDMSYYDAAIGKPPGA